MVTTECATQTFTREEFYELVWTKPATKIAKELGCSNVIIGKVCKSYDIPKPLPGYWARLAYDKSPQRSPLPHDPDPKLQSVTFHRHTDYETTVNEPPRELQYDSDIMQLLKVARALGPVKVSSKLRRPHSLVAATKKRIEIEIAERKIPWSQRIHRSPEKPQLTLSIDVSDALVKRALRLMDAFVKRVEAVGGSIAIESARYNDRIQNTVVKFAGESISVIRLREKHNQVRTKRENSEYSWEQNRTELIPSGRLLFDDGPGSYHSPLAIDGKSKKIEDQLESMILGFVREAGEKRIRRRQEEALAKERAELEHLRIQREEELRQRRELLEKRQAEEQAKLDQLILHAECWRKSQLIREYLDALCDLRTSGYGVVELDSPLAAYLHWGNDQADRMDPLRPCPHSVLDDPIDEEAAETLPDLNPRKPR